MVEKRLTCLLGSPVAHSLSPAMHNLSFENLGIDCYYEAIDVKIPELPAAVEDLKKRNVLGFNLTMPLKEAIIPLCDELSLASKISGSVNTVLNKDGKLYGYTTDGIGFMEAAREVNMDPVGKTMVVFGGGGAALSILAQAAIDGVKKIYVFNRKGKSWDNIEKKIPLFKEGTKCEIEMKEYADTDGLRKALQEAVLLVNASSVGMAPNEDGCLIEDKTLLHKDLNVFDIIYNPAETKLMKIAAEMGCNTANGKMMLLYQGAAAFKIWTGENMPIDLVKEKVFPNSTTKQ